MPHKSTEKHADMLFGYVFQLRPVIPGYEAGLRADKHDARLNSAAFDDFLHRLTLGKDFVNSQVRSRILLAGMLPACIAESEA